MTNKSRGWTITMYTVNGEELNTNMDHQNTFIMDQDIDGAMWQLERCPETQRLHYQGFFVYKNPRNFNAVKDKWSPHHVEKMKGRVSQNILYCGKEDSRVDGPWRYGTLPEKQGKRNDLEAFKDAVKEGATMEELMEQHSNVVAKHPGFVSLYRSRHAKKQKIIPNGFRKWQKWTIHLVNRDPHEREVYWFYDPEGGNGKTWMSKYLIQQYPGQIFYSNGGKAADILFGYQGEKVVIFDYTRDYQEYVGYGAMEQLKNGIMYSPKYQSVLKHFDTPHVIIFANFKPDFTKLSKDRWRIIEFVNHEVYLKYELNGEQIEEKIQ